jgi:propanol-preferring alcohol dehydrogenase
VGTREDLVEVFALHAAGRTRVIAETRRLEDVNDAIAEVLSGKIAARLVFDYSTPEPTSDGTPRGGRGRNASQ